MEHSNLPSQRRLGQGAKLHPSWWVSHHHAVQGLFTMIGRHRVGRRLINVYWGTTLKCILPTKDAEEPLRNVIAASTKYMFTTDLSTPCNKLTSPRRLSRDLLNGATGATQRCGTRHPTVQLAPLNGAVRATQRCNWRHSTVRYAPLNGAGTGLTGDFPLRVPSCQAQPIKLPGQP